MFLKTSTMKSATSFQNEGVVLGVLRKNTFLADLLGSQYLIGWYLFEILHNSCTVKTGINVIKIDVSKASAMESAIFLAMKEACKVSCVKISF